MKKLVLVFILFVVWCSGAEAANIIKQFSQANATASPRLACKNPRYEFSPREVELCIGIYQSCMRPDLKQYERDLCVIESVKKAKAGKLGPAGAGSRDHTGGGAARQQRTIELSFDAYQAYDLIEVCEQRENRKRPLCRGLIHPNKAKIVQDINALRRK